MDKLCTGSAGRFHRCAPMRFGALARRLAANGATFDVVELTRLCGQHELSCCSSSNGGLVYDLGATARFYFSSSRSPSLLYSAWPNSSTVVALRGRRAGSRRILPADIARDGIVTLRAKRQSRHAGQILASGEPSSWPRHQ